MGGNFITSAAPTNFHQFYKQKILTPAEDISDYREVTASERTALEKSDAAWERPPQGFIDQWNDWCVISAIGVVSTYGAYNESTGYFELNGIKDIGLEEAKAILAYAPMTRFVLPNHGENRWAFGKQTYGSVRTVFPIHFVNSGGASGAADGMFARWSGLEVVESPSSNFSSRKSMFAHCSRLRRVNGLRVHANDPQGNSNMFLGCSSLQEAYLNGLDTDMVFADSPLLTVDSIDYMVKHRSNTNSICLTLHHTAYDRVTEEVFAAAATKNITIAST